MLLIFSAACGTQETRVEPGIIVDNQDPPMELTGNWTLTKSATAYDGECAWAPFWENPADGFIDPGQAARATVRPALAEPGMYEVYAWWCDNDVENLSTKQLIWLCASRGYSCTWIYINPREDPGKWNSLGTFYLDIDGDITVRNGKTNFGAPPGFETIADGAVVVDAFRFVHRSPKARTLTPLPFQPLPSPTDESQ
jgi:hypothetical protein